jgi:hypothetical protein
MIERQYQMVLSRAGAAVGRPMGLPTTKDRSMSQADKVKAAIDLMATPGGAGLSMAGALQQVSGDYDPDAALRAALERKMAEKGAGAAAKAPSARSAPTAWQRAESSGLQRPIQLNEINDRLSPSYIYNFPGR